MEHSTDQMSAMYAALSAAQAEYAPLAKNRKVTIKTRTGGSYDFRYADLEAVFSSTRPALTKQGISFVQTIQPANGRSALVTMIAHKDGGTLVSTIEFNMPSGGDIKDFGAHLTYLRRYAATALLGVAADDDLDENGEPLGAGDSAPLAENPLPEDPAPAAPGLPAYGEATLKKMLPHWCELVQSGKKTPDQIIATVGSRNTLTEGQIAQIRALDKTTPAGEAE